MAEFIAECMPTRDEERIETAVPGKGSPQEWIMYFDAAFSLQGAGGGMLLVAPSGEHLKYVVKEICPRGNNKVVIYISLYHDKCLLFMLELY